MLAAVSLGLSVRGWVFAVLFFYLEGKNLRIPLGFCVMSSWWSLDLGLLEYCVVMVMGEKNKVIHTLWKILWPVCLGRSSRALKRCLEASCVCSGVFFFLNQSPFFEPTVKKTPS